MIKLAVIIPSLEVGGAENMVVQIVTHIDKSEFQVKLLVLSEEKDTQLKRYIDGNGIDIVYFNKKAGINYSVIFDISKTLSDFCPDIIHTHLHSFAYVFFWVLLHNKKMIHTIHSKPIFELSLKGKVLIQILYSTKKAIPVAISELISRETMSLYHLKSTEIIYNPVDLSKYSSKKTACSGSVVKYVNIGRLEKVKNQELLLNSFSELIKKNPNVELVIAGDGSERKNLESLISDRLLTSKVKLAGNISNVDELLSQSDVFVLSSNYEGLPLTILEAMAAGLPIIATRVGGVPDIVTNNGILVDPNNVNQLAEAMIEIGFDQDLRQSFGRKSLENVQIFDINIITKEYELLYRRNIKR